MRSHDGTVSFFVNLTLPLSPIKLFVPASLIKLYIVKVGNLDL